MVKTLDIACTGYSVKADIYESNSDGPVVLLLIGRSSRRKKQHYIDFSIRVADSLNITSVVFDYTGHGDSPFDIEELYPAQHLLEAVTVFDWMKERYPKRRFVVIGSSYGGFQAAQLTQYRKFDTLVLRAPAIYHPADFYTCKKDEDEEAIVDFRKDAQGLATHPLLKRASKFEGHTLVVVHERDERIPTETTDAYANAFDADVIVEKDITHSLDDATPAQIKTYFQDIEGWLCSHL